MVKKTTERFILDSREIHGGRYTYTTTIYVGANKSLTIGCPDHGEFTQRASSHLGGSGCPKCARVKVTTADFITRAAIAHDGKYDYSMTEYSPGSVEIICREHGLFIQNPHSHLSGKGCPWCGGSRRNTVDSFIQKAREVHGSTYNYSKSVYTNNKGRVCITCPEHGDFHQFAQDHLKGHGCPKCGRTNSSNHSSYSLEEFITIANQVHDGAYTYTEYTNTRTKIPIGCRIHGVFLQAPYSHIQGHGCPKCETIVSRPHNEVIEFISSLGYNCIINDRSILEPLELDIVVEGTDLAVEIHGDYWHSYDRDIEEFELMRHQRKALRAAGKEIRLIQLFVSEWKHKRELCERIIKDALGRSQKIGIRECSVIEQGAAELANCAKENSLNDCIDQDLALGAVYQGRLVSVLSYRVEGEVVKFKYSDSPGFNVDGGLHLMISKMVDTLSPSKIETELDLRIHPLNPDLYIKEGFRLAGIIKPRSFFVKNGRKVSYSGPNVGYREVWDAGYALYEKIL